ncbi:MAG: radical SAM protein, partial [Candidatus Nezhaarchaeales archaeon]
MEVALGRRRLRVIEDPCPHVVVPTKKEVVHGWFYGYRDRGRRECSAERILLNPYNGCTVNCPMCYSRGFGGYFDLWHRTGIVTVFEGFDSKCARELDGLYVASCAYLSPITDPFQRPLENKYRLSELTAYAFLDRGLPVEFITKVGDNVPPRLLDRMAESPHSFAQFTVLSADEEVRRAFAPGGSSAEDQFRAIRRAADRGLYVVVRMDPLLPGITDGRRSIEEVVARAAREGARHAIFSVCDLGEPWAEATLRVVEERFPWALGAWRRVYRWRRGSPRADADIRYRREVFKQAREVCSSLGLTMSLCMEFEEVWGEEGLRFRGLNEDFMTSTCCEGKETPIYYRTSLKERFRPLDGCNGNCLACAKGLQ